MSMDRIRGGESSTMLTDDVVAEILAREAREASIRYSTMGLEAFRTAKPQHKAKPNTRFLGRIIKETESHNAALSAREAAEAQARLDVLTQQEGRKRRRLDLSDADIRRRQLGNISSILQGRRQDSETRRLGREKREECSRERSHCDDRDHRKKRDKQTERDKDDKHHPQGTTEHRNSGRRSSHRSYQERSRSPSHRESSYRHRSPISSESGYKRSRYSNSFQEKSTKDRESEEKICHRQVDNKPTPPAKSPELSHPDDSDPLEDFIGPAPPPKSLVRTRGRGAIKGPAALDGRFADDYDPTSDVQPEVHETDSWDEAVEVYRDRQKWRQLGAERLRAAGFTEEQIRKWEKGGEKDIDDVKWSKPGEEREWDRGKEKVYL